MVCSRSNLALALWSLNKTQRELEWRSNRCTHGLPRAYDAPPQTLRAPYNTQSLLFYHSRNSSTSRKTIARQCPIYSIIVHGVCRGPYFIQAEGAESNAFHTVVTTYAAFIPSLSEASTRGQHEAQYSSMKIDDRRDG